jgi:hypothetical protein
VSEDRYWRDGAAVIRDLWGPYAYACPLCLRLFPRDQIEHLHPDHVPPRSVGAKLEVLTCDKCNHPAGAELDAHAANVERLRRIIAGEPYERELARVKIDGVTANMELRSDGKLHEILGAPEHNPPGALADFIAVFDAHISAGTHPSMEFTVPTLKFSPRRAAVSDLRAGYLAAFAAMGYTAVARTSFDRVRQQIWEPEAEHLPHFISHSGDRHGYRVGVVKEPTWASSIVVLLGKHQILLPLFDDAGVYERISERAAAGERAKLRWQDWGWPRRPAYHVDRQLAQARGIGKTPTGPVG